MYTTYRHPPCYFTFYMLRSKFKSLWQFDFECGFDKYVKIWFYSWYDFIGIEIFYICRIVNVNIKNTVDFISIPGVFRFILFELVLVKTDVSLVHP